jgi:hypothetical protein
MAAALVSQTALAIRQTATQAVEEMEEVGENLDPEEHSLEIPPEMAVRVAAAVQAHATIPIILTTHGVHTAAAVTVAIQ